MSRSKVITCNTPCHACDHLYQILDCFTSHVGEHRSVRGLWKIQGIPCVFKIPTVQQSPEGETLFVYVTLATHVTLATAGYTPCLFGYVTIGLVRHNRTLFSQSERLLVKPQRPCTDLCAEPVGVWNRLTKYGKNPSWTVDGTEQTIFKAKAKWPWRYRSRSKVIICNTPSHTSDHLC